MLSAVRHTPAPTSRRRRSGSKMALGFAALGAAALLAIVFALGRERRDIVSPAAPHSIDLEEVSAQGEAAIAQAARLPPPPSLDAAAPAPRPSMGVVAPIPIEGMSGTVRKPRPGGPGKVPVVTAKAVRWVRTHKVFAAFLKAPARYLAGKGDRMSSPAAFRAFLDDKKQVNAFLDSPLVRVALNSPVVSRALMSDPGVVKAFLGSPAMQDPATVKQFLTSPLFRKVIDCPGPQGAIEDGRTLPQTLTNPEVISWMKENPGGMRALTEAIPALAAMNPGVPKKRRGP